MENILHEIIKQCNITLNDIKKLTGTNKHTFYKTFKNKLDIYKRDKESSIRKLYEEQKKRDLKSICKEINNSQAMLLSMLNINVSKRKNTISENIRHDIWINKFGENINGTCPVCCEELITKHICNSCYIVPESKGGITDKINIIPICVKCYNKVMDTHENLVVYLNRIKPIVTSDHQSLYDNIVNKYTLFHYNTSNKQITFPSCVSHMQQYMCLCQSKYEILNKDYNNFLDIDIMKIVGIIKYSGTLDLTSYKGKYEICYYIDIIMLMQYLKLMKPYVEHRVSFDFTQNNINMMDKIHTNNFIFGSNY